MKDSFFDDKESRCAGRPGNRTLAFFVCLASAAMLAGCGSEKREEIRSIDDLKKDGDDRNARDELRKVRIEPSILHGPGRHLRRRHAGADILSSTERTHERERFDPKDAGNDISYSVLKHSVDELKYEYTDQETSPEAIKDTGSVDDRKVESSDSASGINTVTVVINEEKS